MYTIRTYCLLLLSLLFIISCRQPTYHIHEDFPQVGTVSPITGASEQILHRQAYILSYNTSTRCPNWVAWHLTADHTNGTSPRLSGNAFHEDSAVPTPRATPADYKGSHWSRGHMCPAGDNKWNSQAMYESYLLTNVCPQSPQCNSGVWNQIEQSCRQWADKYGELYIICGPVFLKSKQAATIGTNQVAVPDAFFKVILCPSPPKAIGFICRNDTGQHTPHRKDHYVNSLAEIERITGLQFFPQLPEHTRQQIQHQADITQW